MRLRSILVVTLCLGVLGFAFFSFLSTREEGRRPRRFPTEQAAVEQLRKHQDAYRAIAEDWLATGNRLLYWFGREDGREMYTWNDYWVRVNGPVWEVMHFNGHEYINQPIKTFEESTRLCGSSPEEISWWLRRLDALGINTLERISGTDGGAPFNYVEIGYFPATRPYGFRFAPPGDHAAQQELQILANLYRSPLYRLHALDDQWFYFEGNLPWARPPLR